MTKKAAAVFSISDLDVDTREMAYFFDLGSSNTSRACSTRLFAVRSSLPTVTRTGSRWNEAASLRTESGHVALTREFCELLGMWTGVQCFPRTHQGLSTLAGGISNDCSNIILETFV